MVRVPTSNKYQWFICTVPTWLPNVLNVVYTERAEENNMEEEVERLDHHGQTDAVRWMLTYFG
jgi:hypothetical protein